MPRTRPLDTDDFATQSVTPDFGYDTGRVLRIGVFFLAKYPHLHAFAPDCALCALRRQNACL